MCSPSQGTSIKPLKRREEIYNGNSDNHFEIIGLGDTCFNQDGVNI